MAAGEAAAAGDGRDQYRSADGSVVRERAGRRRRRRLLLPLLLLPPPPSVTSHLVTSSHRPGPAEREIVVRASGRS